MRLTGNTILHAPAGRVWAALSDPAVLARTIPGCERLEVSGPGCYRVTVTAGMASTRGTYAGEVSLSDRHEPTSFRLSATGAGTPGTVSADVRVQLAGDADGSTRLSYDADAAVAGMIASVGQHMVTAIANRMAGEFFASLDGLLTGEAELAGAATQERWRTAGAADVSFPPPAVPPRAWGTTREPPTAPSQLAGRTGAGAPEHGRQASADVTAQPTGRPAAGAAGPDAAASGRPGAGAPEHGGQAPAGVPAQLAGWPVAGAERPGSGAAEGHGAGAAGVPGAGGDGFLRGLLTGAAIALAAVIAGRRIAGGRIAGGRIVGRRIAGGRIARRSPGRDR